MIQAILFAPANSLDFVVLSQVKQRPVIWLCGSLFYFLDLFCLYSMGCIRTYYLFQPVHAKSSAPLYWLLGLNWPGPYHTDQGRYLLGLCLVARWAPSTKKQ